MSIHHQKWEVSTVLVHFWHRPVLSLLADTRPLLEDWPTNRTIIKNRQELKVFISIYRQPYSKMNRSIHCLQMPWIVSIFWLRPITVQSDAHFTLLRSSIFSIVYSPSLCMSFYNIVSTNILLSWWFFKGFLFSEIPISRAKNVRLIEGQPPLDSIPERLISYSSIVSKMIYNRIVQPAAIKSERCVPVIKPTV